ncbi:hypothetical protein [Alicyclobacillus dauci]|uniref:Uncharacterized protein n=1 Tax=Alicyclobacillus dauci TaxID=1475485 RepID=A0ABY6Z0P1_9BACL|nr:hypothetical protein [Alicyclobacillus dauci]WAH35931.1 hypothetical protein NZD86_16900 [Alicyclobacillus dauci]
MTSRRKSIGRGDEARGPVINAEASAKMRRGEREDTPHRYGHPQPGMYSRKIGGTYGASVSDLQ